MRKFLLAMAVFVLPLCLSLSAFGQTAGSAAVSGTVTDSSRALIPGATVRATAVDTGIVTTTITNETGSYSFPNLLPGNYTLGASLPGFQSKNITGLALGQGTAYRFNFELSLSTVSTQVEVSIAGDTILATSGATIGQVLSQQRVSDLPMVGNNVLQLIGVLAGVENVTEGAFGREGTTFAGISAANITTVRDGIMVQDTRWPTGINSATVINPDLVGEVRLILAPVDAEIGRGNGTVQIQTRSGTNRYNGAAVWSFRNTALDPNSWSNNRNQTQVPGVPTNPDGTPSATVPNWSNTHQGTISYGGPIVRNKTFFYALYDFNNSVGRVSTNFQVLTPCARNGIFRYFPGWNSNDALGAVTGGTNPSRAVVDAVGNPVRPDTNPNGTPYTGNLSYFSVFGPIAGTPTKADCSDLVNTSTLVPNGSATTWDPHRRAIDSTGYVSRFLGKMPLPNNYDVGDGLNIAGFRWLRHTHGLDNLFGVGEATGVRKQINLKIDQNFTQNHKANFNISYERTTSDDVVMGWPDTFSNKNFRRPLVFTTSFTSTLSPSLLNEARFGVRRTGTNVVAPWEIPDNRDAVRALLPADVNGFEIIPRLENGNMPFCSLVSGGRPNANANSGGCAGGALTAYATDITPVYTYADTLSWTRGAHAMRFGGELRVSSSTSKVDGPFFSDFKTKIATAVGGSAPNATQNNATFASGSAATPGLGGTDATRARALQNFLAGSVSSIGHLNWITDPNNLTQWTNGGNSESRYKETELNQTEFSAFFKDDYKITKNLTLNLGGRWEYYGVPFVGSGLTVSPVGGGAAALGISGRDLTGWMRPGVRADVMALEFIGPNSPNPNKTVYPNDWNNFGPAIGFAWQVPWFGEGKTTVRGGYQVTYQTRGFSSIEGALSSAPGATYNASYSGDSSTPYLDLTSLAAGLPAPVPTLPMQPILLTDRGSSITTFDPDYVSPYVQNLTMSVTRSVSRNLTLDVRYVGTLARKQFGGINLNTRNFLYNGLLDEFNSIRTGGESAMLNQMFAGINICASGCGNANNFGPVGTVKNGVLQTAALQMRSSSTFQSNLANGNYNGLASTLNTLNYSKAGGQNSSLPNVPSTVRGSVLRHSGLFPENFISTNPQFNNVTMLTNYDSNNYHSLQTEITLRPISGISGQATYSWSKNLGLGDLTNPVDRRADYTHVGNNRGHQLRTNGTFELPFGPNKFLFGNSSGVLARAIEGWRLGLIYNLSSGAPTSITASDMVYDNGVPDVVVPVDFNKLAGTRWGIPAGNFLEGRYFDNNDLFVKVDDPQCATVTSLQGLNGNNRCTLDALAMIVPAGTANSFTLADGTNRSAQIVLQHPQPGKKGNLGNNTVLGMGTWRFDANMSKSFRISESKTLQLRVDTLNVLNHPQPNNPNLSITGNAPFGQITSKSGQRSFQGQLRLTF
jgi:hypothetical protein